MLREVCYFVQDAFVDELVELGIQALQDRHWLVIALSPIKWLPSTSCCSFNDIRQL